MIFSMPTNQEVLYEHVDKTFPGHDVNLTYEAECCGISTVRYVLNLGWQVTVVNLGNYSGS